MVSTEAKFESAQIDAGDEEARDGFCRDHSEYLTLVLRKWGAERLQGEELGEDLFGQIIHDAVVDALLYGMRNILKYDSARADVRTWLVWIGWSYLRRRMRTERARLYRERSLERGHVVASLVLGPEFDLAAKELSGEITSVLDQIKPRHANALLLSGYFGYSMEEIAKLLGLPTHEAASSLVRRARVAFRRVWKAKRKL